MVHHVLTHSLHFNDYKSEIKIMKMESNLFWNERTKSISWLDDSYFSHLLRSVRMPLDMAFCPQLSLSTQV